MAGCCGAYARDLLRGQRTVGVVVGGEAERLRRFRQHLFDRRDYLRSTESGLRNYAAERRKGLKISSAPAESLMSHLVRSHFKTLYKRVELM